MKALFSSPLIDGHDQSTWLDRGILRLGQLLSWLFLITACISLFEVVMRYVFNSPTIWVHESAAFFGGSLFVFGGLYALASEKHVRVVLLYDAVSPKTRCWLNIFHHLGGLLFCGLMSYASWFMTINAWRAPWGDWHLETSGSAWNPPFPALLKAIILICVVVMGVQFLLHLVRDVRRLIRGDYV